MEKSPSHWWDFPSAILLLLAILFSAWRLIVTNWTEHLGFAVNLALAGVILGLALGASRFEKRVVRWLVIEYSLVMIPLQLIALYDSDIYLGDQLHGIFGRLLFAIGEFAANRPVEDPLLFLVLMSILYWFVSLSAGYSLARYGNTLAAVLPAGIVMLVIHQFDFASPKYAWLIAAYLLLALALLGRVQYLQNRAGWLKRKFQFTPEMGSALNASVVIGAVVLVLLAWNLPLAGSPVLADQWEQATRPWRAVRDRLSRAFTSLEGKSRSAENYRSALPLGNHASQDETLIFKVDVSPSALELPRLYWRARVYDHYENGIWSETPGELSSFTPQGSFLPITDTVNRKVYEFTFTPYIRQSILYAPAQPLWFSRPAAVTSYHLSSRQQDVLFLEARPFLSAGENYRTLSSIANPSFQELQQAGEDYPFYIKNRYLQLPENFSSRIEALAEEIASGQETPYDKAVAVTDYLRTHIRYSPDIILPPEGTDVMEWFLFEGREGYCNYYATAEVLMLRSLGIPARMAVGFAQGQATTEEQVYLVRNKDAHAWPEVYFPGYGWIEFEPTASQPTLARPDQAELEPPAAPTNVPVPTKPPIQKPADGANPVTTAETLLKSWLVPLTEMAAAILFVFALFFLNRRFDVTRRAAVYILSAAERRGARTPAWVRNAALYILADPFERAFYPVNQVLRWLGKPPAAHLTPFERAHSLSTRLPAATDAIETLLKEYQSARYTPRGGDLRAARRASRQVAWYGLRAALRRGRK